MAVYRGSVSEQRATVSDAAISSLLGAAIREARQSRKLSMRALAASANVSQPFLSTVESGQTMPSLASLYRIAAALEVSPSHLLPAAGEPEPITVSRRDASGWAPITDHPDTGFHRVVSSGTARRATVQEYVLEPGQRLGDWYQSDGALTVYVAEGSITVEVEGRGSWELDEGEAIAHPGALRNHWSVRGNGRTRIVLVYAGDS